MKERSNREGHGLQRGVGLIEVMVSIVIAMLLVLVIYQIYEISEGQKRTITAGSDAQQNAAYGMYMIGRDLAIAGNGMASTSELLQRCVNGNLALPASRTSPDPLQYLVPVPVVIKAGADANTPDEITVFYGASASLSTAVPLTGPYQVSDPVGLFRPNDVIAAVRPDPLPAQCTLSTVAGVAVAAGKVTITPAFFAGDPDPGYTTGASLINLGQASAMGRVVYSVDSTTNSLRSQDQFTKIPPLTTATTPAPLVSDVVNLKAQYGVDSNCDGVLTWQAATGSWSSNNVPALPLSTGPTPPGCTAGVPSLRQIWAIRVAIVTRSSQYEKDPVTTGPLTMLDGTVSMTLSTDDTHYRYKVLETIVPLRNAIWNTQ